MSGVNTTVLAAMLAPNVDPVSADLLYRETDYVNLLRANGRVKSLSGASPHQWPVITASNASVEAYSEAQAPAAPGSQTRVLASVGHFRVRATIGHSGDARDNDARGGFHVPVLSDEKKQGLQDLMKGLEDQLIGSTQDRGMASIIDATGTYAGLAQGTYSIWASEENGSISTLGLDDMENLYWELRAGTAGGIARNSRPTHVLAPTNQAKNFGRTVGPAAATSLARFDTSKPFDPGILDTAMSFMGMPISIINGMTVTELKSPS